MWLFFGWVNIVWCIGIVWMFIFFVEVVIRSLGICGFGGGCKIFGDEFGIFLWFVLVLYMLISFLVLLY